MAMLHTLIFFIIGTIPILFAAVQPWVWSVYSLSMIAAFLIFFWKNRINTSFTLAPFVSLTIVIFFAATTILCLPLPPRILSYLSPIRFQTLEVAWVLLDSPPTWQTISYSPRVAFSWWVFLFGLSLFFIVVQDVCAEPKKLKRIVCVMIALALLEAAYGLIQVLIPTLGVLWADAATATGNAQGTFINRNHFAGFIEMVWPLSLGYTLAQGDWRRGYPLKKILASIRFDRQLLLAVVNVVLLLALLFSRSRAGIGGALIGFVIFLLLTRSGIKGKSLNTWLLLGGIAGLVIVYSFKIGIDSILDRFLLLSNGISRLDYWRDSLLIIKDHPLGIGFRNYENVFPVYNISTVSAGIVDFAHNDYLQLLIEAGWVGFLAAVSGFLIFLSKSAYRIRRLNFQKDPMMFFLSAGAFSGLVSMSFHSFFDFNLQIPANCVYFVTLIAVVYTCALRKQPAIASRRLIDDRKAH